MTRHPHAYEFAQAQHSHAGGAAASGPSYPSYAHYDIPTTRPTTLDRKPSSSSSTELKPSPQLTDLFLLKKGEYPEDWTEQDIKAEETFLKTSMYDWRRWLHWRFWLRLKWWYWYVILVLIGVLVLLMTLYHDKIVDWLTPIANVMKKLPGGWAIPIAIIFVLSFPPLFGQEIVAILCGLVWGLWIGFGIVAAGTFLGEVANFYAFMYCFRRSAAKYENKDMTYACLAEAMRQSGFWLVCAARLSAIPGHFTTAVFSTCGMNQWKFMLATLITLPKQLIVVYLGVLYKEKVKTSKDKIISGVVLGVAVVITIGSMWWIHYEMKKVRLPVWRRTRRAEKAKGIPLQELRYSADPYAGDATTPILARHPSPSDGLAAPGAHGGEYGKHSSYINPYDIQYNRDGDMSVYHVDAMSERVQMEQKMASRLNHHGAPPVPAVPNEYAQHGSGGHSRSRSRSRSGSSNHGAGFPQPHPAPTHSSSPPRYYGGRV